MKKIAYTHSYQVPMPSGLRHDEWLYASSVAPCSPELRSIFHMPLLESEEEERDTNCRNCGAPADEAVCAYCGTRHE